MKIKYNNINWFSKALFHLSVLCILFSGYGVNLNSDGLSSGNKMIDLSRLKSIVENETDAQYGGIGVCLFSDQGPIWHYESTGSEYRVAFDENTEIHIGGLSKQFTILAVRALCADGIIDINSSVSRYLPEIFPDSSVSSNIGKIGRLKIRSLLIEASGYADRPILAMSGNQDASNLIKRLNEAKCLYSEGVRRSESALMMTVLGLLIEKVSGKPFSSFVRDEVYRPFGMTASSFEKNSTPLEESKFYHSGGEPFIDSSSDMYNYLDPSFSMRSTISDLVHCYSYMLKVMDGKQTNRMRMINLAALFSSTMEEQLNKQGYESGEGWILTESSLGYLGSIAWAEGTYLSHSVVVILARKQGIGIVLARNIYSKSGTTDLRNAGVKILKRYIEEEFGVRPPVFSAPKPRDIPIHLAPLPGLYASPEGVAIVDVRKDFVTVQFNGAYSEFVFSNDRSFLPKRENEFKGLEVIDKDSFMIQWTTGAQTLVRKPSFIQYSFIVSPRKGVYRRGTDFSSSGWSGAWVIASYDQYFTISSDDGKEYLLLATSPKTAQILCNDGSVFFNKQVLIGPQGEVSITSAEPESQQPAP